MLIIFGKKISSNKNIRYALPILYGIGLYQSNKICDQLGFPPLLKVSQLNETQKLNLSKYIKKNFIIENQLYKKIQLNLEKLNENLSIRGFRHRAGLPVRGQRTHSNAQTAKRLKNFSLKKKSK